MTVLTAFGNGWNAVQWYLPGTDPAALPETYVDGVGTPLPTSTRWYHRHHMDTGSPGHAPSPDALASAPVDAGAGDGLLFDGLVSHRVGDGGWEVFDVVGAWNSVKNVAARIDAPGAYAFDGFVHADVDARGAEGGGVDLLVRGAKRGNLLTGDGDDRIDVEALIRGRAGWDEFRIVSGAGDDEVRFAPLDRSDAVLLRGDPTYAASAGGAADPWAAEALRGAAYADLGDGDDLFYAPGMPSAVRGGAGDDSIVGNVEGPSFDERGVDFDTLEGGGGGDRLSGSGLLDGGAGDDALTGFGTSPGSLFDQTKTPGSGFSTLRGGAGDDTLAGVADLMDGGAGRDVLALPGQPGDYLATAWDIAGQRLTFVDADYRGGYSYLPVEELRSFTVLGVEVVRFEGGGPDLVLA